MMTFLLLAALAILSFLCFTGADGLAVIAGAALVELAAVAHTH
jgi:hypothetical protein